jgi:hypothetical protein
VFVEQVREDNDVGGDAGVTQGHTFLHRRHRQPRNPEFHQRARNLYGAMAIGVRFDDGHDGTVTLQASLKSREIPAEFGEIDACVGGMQGYLRWPGEKEAMLTGLHLVTNG